jgi:hypothetical protein
MNVYLQSVGEKVAMIYARKVGTDIVIPSWITTLLQVVLAIIGALSLCGMLAKDRLMAKAKNPNHLERGVVRLKTWQVLLEYMDVGMDSRLVQESVLEWAATATEDDASKCIEIAKLLG